MIKQLSKASLVATALLCTTVFASSAMVQEFGELDTDGDGAMSESEWMESSTASMMGEDMAAAHYGMYDVDGNGSVSGDEYATVNRATFEQENEAI